MESTNNEDRNHGDNHQIDEGWAILGNGIGNRWDWQGIKLIRDDPKRGWESNGKLGSVKNGNPAICLSGIAAKGFMFRLFRVDQSDSWYCFHGNTLAEQSINYHPEREEKRFWLGFVVGSTIWGIVTAIANYFFK